MKTIRIFKQIERTGISRLLGSLRGDVAAKPGRALCRAEASRCSSGRQSLPIHAGVC